MRSCVLIYVNHRKREESPKYVLFQLNWPFLVSEGNMKSTGERYSEEHLLRGDAPELGMNHAGQTLFKLIILPNRASLDT